MSNLRHHRALYLAPALLLLLTAALSADEFRLERELELPPGGHLELEADAGRVSVRGVERTGASVVITSPREDVESRFSFEFSEQGDRAAIRVKRRGGKLFGWGRGDSLRFEIEVPRSTTLDLDTAGGAIEVRQIAAKVEARTSGGQIDLAEIDSDATASTSGGSIAARQIGGDLRADTSGGSIRAEEVAGHLHAETSGGSIRISEAGGRVEASTSGGSVSVQFSPGNAFGGSLSTSGGSVTASVDPAASLDIDAETSGGRVTLDLPVEVQGSLSQRAVRGRLNGGGSPLRLHSSGGSVRLKSL